MNIKMKTLKHLTARKNLANVINDVVDDHTPIIIKGSDKAVVMMSLNDWNAWQETMYLLRSPANNERFLEATRDFEKLS